MSTYSPQQHLAWMQERAHLISGLHSYVFTARLSNELHTINREVIDSKQILEGSSVPLLKENVDSIGESVDGIFLLFKEFRDNPSTKVRGELDIKSLAPFDYIEAIQEALPAIPAENHRIIYDSSMDHQLFSDRQVFIYALRELAMNSVEEFDARGVKGTISITNDAFKRLDTIEVVVEDHLEPRDEMAAGEIQGGLNLKNLPGPSVSRKESHSPLLERGYGLLLARHLLSTAGATLDYAPGTGFKMTFPGQKEQA